MRLQTFVVSVVVAGLMTSASHADFTFLNPVGNYHIAGQAFDDSGDGFNFDWQDTFGLGDSSDSDFSETFGQWTYSGAAYLATVTSTYIDLRGFTDATGANLESSAATAFAGITMTFTIESARYVDVDYFTFFEGEEDTYATISFTGPNGVVPVGLQVLEAGVYQFSGAAGFTNLQLGPGTETTYARFFFSIEQVPAPGALTLFAMTGLFAGRRRRA